MNNLTENNRFSDQDLTKDPPGYDAGVIAICP
jgi:hypothetical protein